MEEWSEHAKENMEMRCKGCLINMQDIQATMKQVIKHMETKANKIYWK